MFALTGGLYLGWSLGANDAANCFGTAVASRIVSFRKACVLCGGAAIIGAILQGEKGIHTLSGLTEQNLTKLLVISLSAAFTVTLMTLWGLPISTSQAVVGAIAGVGLVGGTMYWAGLEKVIICWIATPIGAMLIAMVVYKLLSWLINYVPMSILTRDKILWSGLLIVGVYGSYALGANNVANATGIFSGQFDGVTDRHLAMFGGFAIAVGVLTFSRRVMTSVGSGIMHLDAFTAFTAVSAMSITTHIFAVIGVPVSTSQGIVGAIIGIGMMREIRSVKFRLLRNISFAWLLTPTVALVLASAAYGITMGIQK